MIEPKLKRQWEALDGDVQLVTRAMFEFFEGPCMQAEVIGAQKRLGLVGPVMSLPSMRSIVDASRVYIAMRDHARKERDGGLPNTDHG